LLGHPALSLESVTSRSFAGQPVWHAHAPLRGQTDLAFSDPTDLDIRHLDGVFIAAEHGKGVEAVQHLLADGFEGVIVDLSADLRFKDPALYDIWFGYTHPAPDLLHAFVYGLAEVNAPYPEGTKWIANPGCFASGIGLALWPIAQHIPTLHASVTALTGASGSGTRAKATTHYPTRDGNVRAYKILAHQHLPEIQQTLGADATVALVPVSGPWTRGIWGTAHITLPEGITKDDVGSWFEAAYAAGACVRLWPDQLPELRYAVGTPFCDIGWVVEGNQLIVGFALDNLLKGAASQAVQNMNIALGLPETAGLVIPSMPVLNHG
jgi:N-acetyl-gamma-glutamyl-phosphate reductase